MRRELVGLKTPGFEGWACSQCAWFFSPSDALKGKTIEEMKESYRQERDQAFVAHSCGDHPKPGPPQAE
jgi:hypothetical protein